MNDKRSALIIMGITGIISVVLAMWMLLLLFVDWIFGSNMTPYFGISAWQGSLLFILYQYFFIVYPFTVGVLLVISSYQYRHQHYRKAYVFSLVPIVLFILFYFFAFYYANPTFQRMSDEQNVVRYEQRFTSYLSTRMNSSDFICNDGRFIRTSPGVSSDDSTVYVGIVEQSTGSSGREFNKLRGFIGWIINIHPKDHSITNRYFVPSNNWIEERKDFFEYIKTCITGDNKSIFDEFPVVPSNIDYVTPKLFQTNPEAFIQKQN